MLGSESSYTNELLWTILIVLGVILILIVLAIIYYFARIAHFSIRRKREKKSGIYKDRKKKIINVDEVALFITNLATALTKLGNNKVGAMLVIENKDNLEKYIQLGNKIDSQFFPEFVYSIFYNHESALHDGTMIIRNLRIASLSSYLPVSKRLLPVKYGSRHRAAFGIAERTDALAFVVSESTGAISFIHNAEYQVLSNDSVKIAHELLDILLAFYFPLVNTKTSLVVQKIKERLS